MFRRPYLLSSHLVLFACAAAPAGQEEGIEYEPPLQGETG